MSKNPKYICLCGNDKDFELISNKNMRYTWKCEKCKRLIKI